MLALKGGGPAPAVSGNEAQKIVSTGKRDNGLFSLQSPPSQALVQREFARSAGIAGIAVKLPDKCKCGGAIAMLCTGRGQHLAELRCETCNAFRARISHRTYAFIAQIVDSCGRPTAPIVMRRGQADHHFGSTSPKARRPLAGSTVRRLTMKRDEIFPSTYYKAADVLGGPIALTISHVMMEPVGDGASKTDKAVAYFVEDNSKRLVLSPTKFDAIALIAKSDDTEDWPGTEIVLEAGKARFQGKLVDCINVRGPKKSAPPKTAKPHPTAPVAPSAAEADFDDEVGF